MSDLAAISKLLDEPVTLRDGLDSCTVKLTEYETLRRTLTRTWGRDLLFDVRIRRSGMPVYYICRTKNDYRASFRFIIEDVYMSPGYPSLDDRFCRLMYLGQESCFLRVSHLRDRTGLVSNQASSPDSGTIDDLLHSVVRNVLQSAWHEDQLPAILTSNRFGLRSLREAIELIYLCLGCDLCGLRTSVDAQMLEFFETVYPQRAIRSFLETLKDRPGRDLGAIEQRALTYYGLLSKEYGRFLCTDAEWTRNGLKHPLFKLIFGNLYRLESLAGLVDLNAALGEASKRLESLSETVISGIVGGETAACAV